MPLAAAVLLDPAGHSVRAKLTPLTGFTRKAITAWAGAHLRSGSQVASGGLACFAGVGEAGCEHLPVVVDAGKPNDLPAFI